MQARWLAPGRPFQRAIAVGTEASRAELGRSAPPLCGPFRARTCGLLGPQGWALPAFCRLGFQSVRFHQPVRFGDKHITG